MKITLLLLLPLSGACLEEKDHCEEYVEYMCDCHADDPDYDCANLQSIYAETDLEQQNECAITLDEQLQEDLDEGKDCEVGGDTGESEDTGGA